MRPTRPSTPAATRAAGVWPARCDEEIADTEGYATVCGRRAVGYRIDPEENEPYPVCTTHHRWPYANQWVSLAAAVARVRALHSQDTSLLAPGKWCPACGDETPCPTIRALDAAPSDPATDTGGEGRG